MTTILLTTLSLLMAGDCRVHRNPDTNEPGFGRNCIILGTVVGRDTCFVDSHWVDMCNHIVDTNKMVRTVCDTAWLDEFTATGWPGQDVDSVRCRVYKVKCHDDTIKADTLPIGVGWPRPIIDTSTMEMRWVGPDEWRLTPKVKRTIRVDTLAGMGLTPAKCTPSPYESRYEIDTSYFLDSTELRILREMITEWQIEKCFKAARNWDYLDRILMRFQWEEQAVMDSCSCVYGGKK